jgi:hypothetical protein
MVVNTFSKLNNILSVYQQVTGMNLPEGTSYKEVIGMIQGDTVPYPNYLTNKERSDSQCWLEKLYHEVEPLYLNRDFDLLYLTHKRTSLRVNMRRFANSQPAITDELSALSSTISGRMSARIKGDQMSIMKEVFGNLYQYPINCTKCFGSGDYVFTDVIDQPRVFIETKNTLKAMFVPHFFQQVEEMHRLAIENNGIAILGIVHPGDEEVFKSWFKDSPFSYQEFKRWLKGMRKRAGFRFHRIMMPPEVFSAPSHQDPNAVENYLNKSERIYRWVMEQHDYWRSRGLLDESGATNYRRQSDSNEAARRKTLMPVGVPGNY